MSVPTQQSHAVPVHYHDVDETQHGILNLNAQWPLLLYIIVGTSRFLLLTGIYSKANR